MQVGDPLTGARFRVEIDGLNASDFLEVVLPEATVAAGREQFTHLVLRRGVSSDRELADWWSQPIARNITLTLLDRLGEAQVRWRAAAAQPVRYALSELNSLEPALVMETLELTVETFERG